MGDDVYERETESEERNSSYKGSSNSSNDLLNFNNFFENLMYIHICRNIVGKCVCVCVCACFFFGGCCLGLTRRQLRRSPVHPISGAKGRWRGSRAARMARMARMRREARGRWARGRQRVNGDPTWTKPYSSVSLVAVGIHFSQVY